jgi:transcription antitermination factor NusG
MQIVGTPKGPIPIEDAEVAAVQTIIESGLPSHPWPFLQVGKRVRVDGGALRGLEGILSKFKGRHRIVVSVALLQSSVALEIDSAWVSSIN